jgi:hypothetical protein
MNMNRPRAFPGLSHSSGDLKWAAAKDLQLSFQVGAGASPTWRGTQDSVTRTLGTGARFALHDGQCGAAAPLPTTYLSRIPNSVDRLSAHSDGRLQFRVGFPQIILFKDYQRSPAAFTRGLQLRTECSTSDDISGLAL